MITEITNQSLNMDTLSISQYRLGAVPPRILNNQHYVNYSDGFGVYVKDRIIHNIMVFYNAEDKQFSPFKGNIVYRDKPFIFNQDSSPSNIEAIFGKPKEQWDDGVNKCLLYDIKEREVEFIWNEGNITTLKYISVCI